jgi:hypothetical protein
MTTIASDSSRIDDPVAATACRLYEAECQLHAAHQSHVDAWIDAANEKLHLAIEEHLAAVRELERRRLRVAS